MFLKKNTAVMDTPQLKLATTFKQRLAAASSTYTCKRPQALSKSQWIRRPRTPPEASDPYSYNNLLNTACDVWCEQMGRNNTSLTPPYMDMENWYLRFGVDPAAYRRHRPVATRRRTESVPSLEMPDDAEESDASVPEVIEETELLTDEFDE